MTAFSTAETASGRSAGHGLPALMTAGQKKTEGDRKKMKIIEKTKFGTYTLEEAKNGNYVIKCEGRIVRRHGEFPTLESAMWRWGCYKYADGK